MSKAITPVHSRMRHTQLALMAASFNPHTRTMDAAAIQGLHDHMGNYGFQMGRGDLGKMNQALFVGDSANYGGLGTQFASPTIGVPVQFLQEWLPGFVYTMLQPRTIDLLAPVAAAGSWHTEEIVQPTLEHIGSAVPYGDHTNIPLAEFNPNYNRRTVVRFEQGFHVGKLEDARLAEIRVGVAQEKRVAANLSLDVSRNEVGFYGFNAPDTRCYGILNDPGLPAFQSVPATGTGGSTKWVDKTFEQITSDIRLMAHALRINSRGRINPQADPIIFALPLDSVDFLTMMNSLGTQSVQEWLDKTYKTWTIHAIPEFDGANGGANVAYLYATNVAEGGTDGGAVLEQFVPARTFALGVEQGAKGYTEDFSNATAGVMVKRPFGVQRWTGM